MSTFCQHPYHRKCEQRGVGGQKSQNLVNVVCERPLIQNMSQVLSNLVKGFTNDVDKILAFLTTYPPALTFSML